MTDKAWKRDVYQGITDRIVAAIEAGASEFSMPWHKGGPTCRRPTNALTGRRYQGVNALALWVASEVEGYGSGLWATFRQWRRLGAQVPYGQKASVIVFYKSVERDVIDNETSELDRKTFFVARSSWVFNADQVNGWEPPAVPLPNSVEALEGAEAFVRAVGADIRHGGDEAYYRPSSDHIQMPDVERFAGSETSTATESYYAVLFHELTHWTGPKHRLDRDLSGRFGAQAYAMEELVAELGAAFLCADLGVTNSPRPDHAAYIRNWLEVLKSDKKAIFTAARKATEAAEFLGAGQDAKAAVPAAAE